MFISFDFVDFSMDIDGFLYECGFFDYFFSFYNYDIDNGLYKSGGKYSIDGYKKIDLFKIRVDFTSVVCYTLYRQLSES
jgi:hypothetical protein